MTDNAAPETGWTTLDYVRYGSNRARLTLRAGLLHQTIALVAGIAAWVWLRDHLAATKYYLGAATPKVIIDKVEPGSTVIRQTLIFHPRWSQGCD